MSVASDSDSTTVGRRVVVVGRRLAALRLGGLDTGNEEEEEEAAASSADKGGDADDGVFLIMERGRASLYDIFVRRIVVFCF